MIVLPINLLLPRRDPSELGLEPDGEETLEPGRSDDTANPGPAASHPPRARSERTLRGALRDARYWYVWAGIFCALFAWYCIQVHQTRFLIDAGFSPATAAWALTLVGVTGIAGLIGIGHLSDRISREWGWTAACGGYVVCYALLLVIERAPSAALMYLMVASQGLLGYGIRLALRIGRRRPLPGPAFRDDIRNPEPRGRPGGGRGSLGSAGSSSMPAAATRPPSRSGCSSPSCPPRASGSPPPAGLGWRCSAATASPHQARRRPFIDRFSGSVLDSRPRAANGGDRIGSFPQRRTRPSNGRGARRDKHEPGETHMKRFPSKTSLGLALLLGTNVAMAECGDVQIAENELGLRPVDGERGQDSFSKKDTAATWSWFPATPCPRSLP